MFGKYIKQRSKKSGLMSILQATSPSQFHFSKYFYTNLYNNGMAIEFATFEKTVFLKTANVLALN